ncbi:MAG: glycosyltransferase family 1 protein [Chloroflexi bacterium]|nr:glycosyltransferase family 1 protein [Chloroflexota bacterium]
MTRTITLLASGTRGDVQPYLALGVGLRDAGFDVRIATHENFAAMIAPTRLAFARLDDNPSDLFARPGGEYALRFDWRHSLHNLRATFEYWRAARPAFARLVISAARAAHGSNALIIGLPTWWGAHIAQALHIPFARCLLQPITPTRDFPSPLLPTTFSLGATYNRLTHRIVAQTMRLAWRDAINQLHPSTPLPSTFAQDSAQDAMTLYGFSSHVVPRPRDWLSEQITGYWFLQTRDSINPALEKFLDAGAPPVYIGFGSIGVRDPDRTRDIILRALADTGLRAVIAVAHNFANTRLPANVFPIDDAPHASLFPRMRAVVHHGGAGTTGAGLRAGAPMIIIPLAVDQFFWGKRVADLGVGTRPIPQNALTRDALIHALECATRDSEIRTRAKILAEKIANEDGVARAVEFIRALV